MTALLPGTTPNYRLLHHVPGLNFQQRPLILDSKDGGQLCSLLDSSHRGSPAQSIQNLPVDGLAANRVRRP